MGQPNTCSTCQHWNDITFNELYGDNEYRRCVRMIPHSLITQAAIAGLKAEDPEDFALHRHMRDQALADAVVFTHASGNDNSCTYTRSDFGCILYQEADDDKY